jgi:Carboxypeptidase regulatory-like domain/TonB dependent receptor-like, beta-barrel
MRRSWTLGSIAAAAGLALLLQTQPIAAQSSGANLKGRATDEQGGALPGVSVTAKAASTGLTRTVVTDREGSYTFASLIPDTYDVTATLAGFKTIDEKGVVLNVATTRVLNFNMTVAAASAVVTVTAETPLVREQPAIGAVVSEKELETLPLNGRQFANLAVLAPGTTLGYNDDPTKPGQLQVQMNAGSGRNVNYVVDGGDNTDDTIGGALQNFSLEGVQEFTIQTQQYKAEYGRSTGGVLNVVTRTGSNAFHGSAFEYFRDKSLNAETESEKLGGSGKSDYRRDQYGASIGGPIVKDAAHFFATYEKTDRKTNFTESPDVAVIYPNLAGVVVPIPFKDELVAAKVTYDASATQFLQARFGYQKNSDKYGAAPTNTPDNLGTVNNKYTSILTGWQSQVSAKSLNEFVFQYTKFDNTISPDSNNPTIYFPNGVISGQNFNTPQSTHQTKYQFKDDFNYSTEIAGQSHDFKFGVNFIHEPQLSGDFSTGVANPQFTVSDNSVTAPVTNITQYGGFFGQSTPVNQYSVYLQDDWRPNRRLTVNAGIRYDLWLGFDLDQHSNAIWQELSTQTKYNENYLQDFQNGGGGKLSNDHKNWGPRLGFSWDATGQAKTFVHGGWGVYYDFPYVNATILFPAGAVQSNYGVAFQSFPTVGGCVRNADGTCFQIGQPLPPNAVSGNAAFPPNEIASPTLKTPFSRQASLGVSTQATDWLGLSLDLVNIGYRDLPFRFKANPIDPTTGARRFPDLGNFRLWYGKGSADYNAINLQFNARVSQKLILQGFYTYANARGNVLVGADEFRLTAGTFQPDLVGGTRKDVSVNPLDPLCSYCSGPLDTDAHHRVTIGATYSAPWGLVLSSVLRYRSALPFMIYDSTIDGVTNKDGFTIDLPPGVGHVNEGRGHSFTQFDLRVSKDFPISGSFGIEVLAEVFNLFNATNPAGYRGDISDPSTFGTPSKYAGDPLQGEQRLLQIGARVHF